MVQSLPPWSTHLCYIKYVGGSGQWVVVGVALSTLDIHRWLATVLGLSLNDAKLESKMQNAVKLIIGIQNAKRRMVRKLTIGIQNANAEW